MWVESTCAITVSAETQGIPSKTRPTAPLSTADIRNRTVVTAMCVQCHIFAPEPMKSATLFRRGQWRRHIDTVTSIITAPLCTNDETKATARAGTVHSSSQPSRTPQCVEQENKQHIPLCRPWWVQTRKLKCKAVKFKKFLGVAVFYWEYEDDSAGSNRSNKSGHPYSKPGQGNS